MRILPAVAIAALIIGAGLAHATTGTSLDAPNWSIGDFWEYAFNTTFEDTVSLDGRVRADVTALRNASVVRVGQDVFVVDAVGSGLLEGVFPSPLGDLPADGTWNLTGEQFITTRSRKIVQSLLDIRASGDAQVPLLGNRPFTFRWLNATTNRVELDEWTYPVAVGTLADIVLNSSWSDDVSITLTGFPPLTFNNTAIATHSLTLTLLRTDTLSVPAGNFDVFVIEERWPDNRREQSYYAPSVGNNAKTIEYNASGGEVSRTELLRYRYQASETGLDPIVIGAIVGGAILATMAAIIVARRWMRRRRAREERYTPPSLREPPT
ncbi:MAG TPA: hypothetical protein VIL58_05030 [Thermoplasmata archaeon]